MKTRCLTCLFVVASLAAFAQGKLIVGNDSAHLFVLGNTLPADAGLGGGSPSVGDTTGAIPVSPLPSGVTLAVGLYTGPSLAALSLQTSIPLTASGWLAPGRMRDFTLASFALPAGSPFYCDIVVYDAAFPLAGSPPHSGPSYFGESGMFLVSGSPGLQGYRLVDYWPDGNLVISVPEPTVFALCSLAILGVRSGYRRDSRQAN